MLGSHWRLGWRRGRHHCAGVVRGALLLNVWFSQCKCWPDELFNWPDSSGRQHKPLAVIIFSGEAWPSNFTLLIPNIHHPQGLLCSSIFFLFRYLERHAALFFSFRASTKQLAFLVSLSLLSIGIDKVKIKDATKSLNDRNGQKYHKWQKNNS